MFQFNNLIDEARVSALLAGGVVALVTSDQEGEIAWWVYGLCIALVLLGMCGGAYFARTKKQDRPFFLWSFCVFFVSVALCAFTSYKSIVPLGEAVSIWGGGVIWMLILSGFYWHIFHRRARRHAGAVDTSVLGTLTMVGALAGGSLFSFAPREVMMPVIGFLILVLIGAALTGLLMFHLRALLDLE